MNPIIFKFILKSTHTCIIFYRSTVIQNLVSSSPKLSFVTVKKQNFPKFKLAEGLKPHTLSQITRHLDFHFGSVLSRQLDRAGKCNGNTLLYSDDS
jgi:hypothetical protein